MENMTRHLIQEIGILKSFNIRQRITMEEFAELYAKFDKECETDEELKEKFENHLQNNSLQQIPGIILASDEEIKQTELMEVGTKLSSVLSRYDKDDQEFILNIIMDILGIDVDEEDGGFEEN